MPVSISLILFLLFLVINVCAAIVFLTSRKKLKIFCTESVSYGHLKLDNDASLAVILFSTCGMAITLIFLLGGIYA